MSKMTKPIQFLIESPSGRVAEDDLAAMNLIKVFIEKNASGQLKERGIFRMPSVADYESELDVTLTESAMETFPMEDSVDDDEDAYEGNIRETVCNEYQYIWPDCLESVIKRDLCLSTGGGSYWSMDESPITVINSPQISFYRVIPSEYLLGHEHNVDQVKDTCDFYDDILVLLGCENEMSLIA